MLTVIFVVVLVAAAALAAAGRGKLGEPIARRPYNNRYNDASAAREDHVA